MTDHNNSNAQDKRPSEEPAQDGHTNVPKDAHTPNLDEQWSEFESSHSEDLKAVAHSRSARHFERHAKREERQALLSVRDLDNGSFTDDMPASGAGPRDSTNSSWLDTDDVMDHNDEAFTPPNPQIEHVPKTTLALWVLVSIGIIGTIASFFVPAMAGTLALLSGVCILIGGAGLIILHRDHSDEPDESPHDFPHGARV